MFDDAKTGRFDLDGALARLYAAAPASVSFRKLRKRLLRRTQEAIARYAMTPAAGERWLVCLSGGKDSHGLLALLLDLKWQGALKADLLACNLDQGQPGFPERALPDYLARLGVPFRIERKDTYSVVAGNTPAGKTYCALCSRLRRGHLYRIAREEGCSAVVLGHHRDDALETFLLNLFHGGRLAAMAPKLRNDAGDLFVLRPLILCAEDDLAKFAAAMRFPVIPCDLCGSQDGLRRQAMKRLLDQWEKAHPGRRETMFRALQNVRPGQLADPSLWDFAALDAGADEADQA
ncbi:tRNA 2-thiocytidine(32) synthetase TtcA [Amphiplicatus metriothermophilus]|uniref:tRNA-cytidine(32) 2-sulfurtransferase n=1 Tax=Amphiplicatus metriothermophilus TaxID=1519374 RepID=A0A239PKN6_9PROT|nr:tRNA 2-thiocytidine(32) synthetase TtcA [Amphiplicatus metriothermophilus]MBB5517520.1 tRNA 2-thiocytidine biosynthesis protein TtcA [Amphiplicatus metriothermophilus]SNT68145.1 tRNA 2-thiocytidine biosynthesis protein TtcA [Amphiplicatus metriothermophilus]